MKVLVKKMSSFGILRVQLIFGAIVMIAAMIALPASVATTDASLLLNPYVFGVVGAGMLMFAAFAYFLFIRPYFLYHKSPEVLAESDGEYLYIHGKKEAKIPLTDLEGAVVTYHLPFVPAFTVHQNSRSLLRLKSIELVMPSNHLILCLPLLLPSVFPRLSVFSNDLVLRCWPPIRWPKLQHQSFQ